MAFPVKHVRTLTERLCIIEEVERNPTEKRIDVARRLGLPPSTLNSIIAKKMKIREQADKCGTSAKKRKTGKESTYSELENVLFAWYQEAQSLGIHVDGSILREKSLKIAATMGIENFSASNGWISRFKQRHGLVVKKSSGETTANAMDLSLSNFKQRHSLVLKKLARENVGLDTNATDLWFERLPENVLFAWYQRAQASGIPVDGNVLREKSLEIAAAMGLENFSALNGWTSLFKERALLNTSAVDADDTDLWFKRLPVLLDGYEARDIYNAHETGLFFNCMPDQTSKLKEESCHEGESSKDRLTVLLCTNSDGSDKRVPLVIGKVLKPLCCKNVKKLPVTYYANTKSWMTSEIFLDFLRDLDSSLETQRRKILLFVDNCPAHSPDLTCLRNIRVVFYPPNCTNVVRPLSSGVIEHFKRVYRRQLVQRAACSMVAGKSDQTKIDVLRAIHLIVSAWQQVPRSKIQNCFVKCGHRKNNEGSEVDESDEEDVMQDEDWVRMGTSTAGVDFDTYVSVDQELATRCEVKGGRCKEDDQSSDDDDETDPETVPSFAEALCAFESVRAFLYAHDITERDQTNIVNIESLLYSLKRKGDNK